MIRWSQLLQNSRRKHQILHGDEMYFASYFSWCGHVARLTKADPQRETSQIFTMKNMEWLRNLKEELGSQCHGRRFGVWRWEQAVAQCVRIGRTNVAQDRLGWRAGMNAMIRWRKTKDDGSKCQSHRMTIGSSTAFSPQQRSMTCGIPYVYMALAYEYVEYAEYEENSSETSDTDED